MRAVESAIITVTSIFTFCSFGFAQELTTSVKVSGIRSDKGRIVIGVFKDNPSFEKEIPYRSMVFDKKSLSNGSMTVPVKLPPGVYSLSLMDDENANGKMEKNMIGMPKEGFGFSNFYLEKLKKPTFDDFKVNLKTDQSKVTIRVKYM